jgi:hypothetical protein
MLSARPSIQRGGGDNSERFFVRQTRARTEARSHECERCTHECVRHKATLDYWNEMVPVLETVPFTPIDTFTVPDPAKLAGNSTLIWSRPAKPPCGPTKAGI